MRAIASVGTRLAVAMLIAGTRIAIAADELSSMTTVFVREIKVEDDALLASAQMRQQLQQYQNRNVSAEELLQLAQQLTAQLIEQGYVNSGVILPDQKVENGVVYLRVIPGRVNQVVVNGNKRVSDRYIATRVSPSSDAPFNINESVRRLQLLERDPRIKKLNAELKPGIERGVALLNIDVEEQRAYGISAGVDNHFSPNVGAYQAVVNAYHLSLLGQGDALLLNYRNAEGFSGGVATYSYPINGRNTVVEANIDYNNSTIVSEPFAELDIEGESISYGIVLRHPFVKTLRNELTLGVGMQTEHVESFLLGEPFSFSASDPDGVSDVTMVLLTQEWVRRTTANVFAIRSSFNIGISALPVTTGGEADGEFVEWLGQVEWVRKIDWLNSTIGLKAQLHLTNDTLPAFRKYALGGANSVRGYRENLIVRDNGVLASAEWAFPVFRFPVRWLGDDPADGQVTLIPFVDYGNGWDYLDTFSEPLDLASAGLAIRWRIGRNSSVDLDFAKALIARDSLTYDKVLQDDGVHFSVRVGF